MNMTAPFFFFLFLTQIDAQSKKYITSCNAYLIPILLTWTVSNINQLPANSGTARKE
jgi:hypothetical protein